MKKVLLGLGILMLFVVSCDGKETSSIISNESILSNESSEIVESIEISENESSEVFIESIISSEESISNNETTMEIVEDKGNIEYGSLDW